MYVVEEELLTKTSQFEVDRVLIFLPRFAIELDVHTLCSINMFYV